MNWTRRRRQIQRSVGSRPDLQLQQRAYYNLGRTRFTGAGQQISGHSIKKQEAWEKAIAKSYESALKLNQQ